MSSGGVVTRKDEENLALFESVLFHHHGNAYRSFIQESPITDRLERMSEFIKLNFGLSNGIEYTRFMAEARQIPANFIVPEGHGQFTLGNKKVVQEFTMRKDIEASTLEESPNKNNLQPLKRKWMTAFSSSMENVNGEVESLGLETADGDTIMFGEPLPLPDPPKIIELIENNEGTESDNSDEFFSNFNSNPEVTQPSAVSLRYPQASVLPSEPCPMLKDPLLNEPSSEFLKPGPVGAPKNNANPPNSMVEGSNTENNIKNVKRGRGRFFIIKKLSKPSSSGSPSFPNELDHLPLSSEDHGVPQKNDGNVDEGPSSSQDTSKSTKSSKSSSESSSTQLKEFQTSSGTSGGGKGIEQPLQSPKEGQEAPVKHRRKAEKPKKIHQTTPNTHQIPEIFFYRSIQRYSKSSNSIKLSKIPSLSNKGLEVPQKNNGKGLNSSGKFSKSSKSSSESSSTPLKEFQTGFGTSGGGKGSGGPLQAPKEGQEAPQKAEEPQKKAEEPQKIRQTIPKTPQTPKKRVTFAESVQEIPKIEDEEGKEDELVKSTTIWGTIDEGETVFARWKDKNYYSGKIFEKGMDSEDAWKIAFDDNTLASIPSETHILPMKVLGVGIQCVYCPDIVYQPSCCTIIGQKFLNDGTVQYAVQCIDKPCPLFCTRRHLSIKEFEAKKIRKEFDALNISKSSDVRESEDVKEASMTRAKVGRPKKTHKPLTPVKVQEKNKKATPKTPKKVPESKKMSQNTKDNKGTKRKSPEGDAKAQKPSKSPFLMVIEVSNEI